MTLRLRAQGPIAELDGPTRMALVERAPMDDPGVAETVAGLLREVRSGGDEALLDMADRFDGVRIQSIEIGRERCEEARASLDPPIREALERAASNIRRFHEAQRPDDVTVEVEPGVRVTRTWVPLERVGVYAPGGTAAYPSSVLMGVVPARAAGVGEVVLCTPPGSDGVPPESVLAACAIADVDRVFALGGAGAVGAMAFGTATVPQVDAIVGPGNRWVTEAKRQVAGSLVIDAPAGPSEVLVLADDTTPPALVAHEMLAQAEHDPDAACVAVTTSEPLARQVAQELELLLGGAPRAAIALRALAQAGGVLVAASMEEAVRFAEEFAPEHLSIMTRDALRYARTMRNAGTIFVGAPASVAFGDYLSGANHVLPTAGRARSFSGLSTHHYLRSYTIQEIDSAGAAAMADDVARLAEAEGLPAHAAAARARA